MQLHTHQKVLDIGAKLAYQGFGLVGYYYDGEGLGSQIATIGNPQLRLL